MKKQVIVTKCLENGVKRVFETQEEAGEALGVTGPSVSLACVEGRPTAGHLARRGERVFAVHMRAYNCWMVCVRNPHGKFVELGNPSRRLLDEEWDEARDITVGWYWPEGK